MEMLREEKFGGRVPVAEMMEGSYGFSSYLPRHAISRLSAFHSLSLLFEKDYDPIPTPSPSSLTSDFSPSLATTSLAPSLTSPPPPHLNPRPLLQPPLRHSKIREEPVLKIRMKDPFEAVFESPPPSPSQPIATTDDEEPPLSPAIDLNFDDTTALLRPALPPHEEDDDDDEPSRTTPVAKGIS